MFFSTRSTALAKRLRGPLNCLLVISLLLPSFATIFQPQPVFASVTPISVGHISNANSPSLLTAPQANNASDLGIDVHESATLQSAPLPTPSGALPPYPDNHTLDSRPQIVGTPPFNYDLEAAGPSDTGTPPANYDFSASSTPVGTPPSNHDFEAGGFTGWTITGTVTLETNPDGTHWAKLANNGQLLSDPFTIDANAQQILLDYIDLGIARFQVFLRYGPNYANEVLLAGTECSPCNVWNRVGFPVSAYQGQSVQLRIVRTRGTLGLDRIQPEIVFPDYVATGTVQRVVDAGNTYAKLTGGASLITDPFDLTSSTQYLSLRVLKTGTVNSYQVYVLSGPNHATETQIAYANAGSSWQTVKINASLWQGQNIRLKIIGANTAVDDIGPQSIATPGWYHTEGSTFIAIEGTNHYLNTDRTIISDPIVLDPAIQQLSMRARAAVAGQTRFEFALLHGPNFSQETGIQPSGGITSTWETLRVGLQSFAGQTVRIKLVAQQGTVHFDDIAIGESILPGWTVLNGVSIVAGEDSFGSYVKSGKSGTGLELKSSMIDVNMLDAASRTDWRHFTLSYDMPNYYALGLTLDWVGEAHGTLQLFRDTSSTPTGYRTKYVGLYDGFGTHGYFVIKLPPETKLYSIADNLARQQMSEPFSQKIGLGIDTTTGNFGYQAQDLAIDGTFPLVFTRYYNAHVDQPGALGHSWSHTYATHLALSENLAGVVMGSGNEVFFYLDGAEGYIPIDVRVHDTLVREQDGTYTFTTKANYKYRFSSTGVLTQVLDPNNNTLQLNYDTSGLLTSVVAPGNTALSFVYDTGKLVTVTDSAGITTTYAYNANDLVSVSSPDRGTEIYTYDHHRLTQVINANNELVVHNEYDQLHRVIQQTDAISQTLALQYRTPDNGATLVTDPASHSTTYYYDRNQRTTNVVNPEGQIYSYLYDDGGNLETVVGGANDTWSFAYDQNGNLLSSQDPLGNPLQITYNPQHLPSTITSGRGYVTTIEYDAGGNVTRQVDPLGNEDLYTYDTAGNLLSHTNPLGHTETYTYDQFGHRLTHTDYLNQTWTYTYDTRGRMVTETDPLNRTTTYGYDAAGRIITIQDALGGVQYYLYDPVGHLLLAEDELERQTFWDHDERGLVVAKYDAGNKVTTYSYDANRNMIAVTNPLSQTTHYEYDAKNQLTKRIEADGATYQYTYDANGRLLTATDPLSHTTSYDYDDAGRLIHMILPDNSYYTYRYDADNNLLESSDPLNRRTSYGYDALSRMITTTNPVGALTSYTYDDLGKVTQVTNALGQTTSYSYDALSRLISVTYPLSQTIYYTYDALGNNTGVTDALGRTETTTYDALYRPHTQTDAGGHTSQWAFDVADQLTSFTAPTGAVTAYAYDPRGLLTQMTNSLNQVTTYIYDDAGRQTQTIDPLNQSTYYAYDPVGHITAVTNPLGKVTHYTHDAAGNQTVVTDPLGRTQTTGYDSRNQPITRTDAAGRTTQLHYDAVGQLHQLVLPSNQTTTFAYDAAGQLTQVTDALGRSELYEYNLIGQTVKTTNRRNVPTLYGYDGAGRLISLTDALGGVVQFGYDIEGQRTHVTNANGQATSYTYDNLGNLLTQTDPLQRVDTYTYDQYGRLNGMTDARGVNVTYAYDLLDRVTSVTYPGGVNSYAYDALGRLASYGDTTGTTTYGYDAASHVTSVAAPQGTISYSYNDAGERTGMTLPGNRSVGYGYDSFGQLTSLTDWLGGTYGLAYNADSRLGSLTRANGVNTTYGYDGVGRLNSISHDGPGGNLQTYTYTLDENGNRVAVSGSGGAESYTLDPLNRLTQVAYATGETVQYSYDANGNRLSETTTNLSGTTVLTSTYDAAGQLLATGVMTYTYDANGNLLNAGADTYSWDWANRLVNASVGGNTASYTYDALNLRVAETVNAQAANLLWDPLTRYPILVDDGQASYLHGVGVLAQFPSGGGSEYLLTDALGSVRSIADGSGALIGTANYDVFGAIVAQSGVASNFGFTGERFSPEVELLHLRARDLQVGLGRFLSVDTVQPNAPGSQGFNLYTYVANNPTTWIDPSGHNAATIAYQVTLTPIMPHIMAFVAWAGAALAARQGTIQVAIGSVVMVGLIFQCITSGPCKEALIAYNRIATDLGSRCFCGVTDWLRDHLPNSPFSYPELPWDPTRLPPFPLDGDEWPDRWWPTPDHGHDPTGGSPNGGDGRRGDGRGGDGRGDDGRGGDGRGFGGAPRDILRGNNGIFDNPLQNLQDLLDALRRLGDIVVELPSFLDNIWQANPAPALKGDPYHPDAVAARQKEWEAYYNRYDPEAAAYKLGYTVRIAAQRAPFNSHGQPVFYNGREYITPDVDEHKTTNGWKLFDKRGNRVGTYSSDLKTRIGK